jgi:hypothetical protein
MEAILYDKPSKTSVVLSSNDKNDANPTRTNSIFDLTRISFDHRLLIVPIKQNFSSHISLQHEHLAFL